MATTFILKRKYFAESDEKKGSGVGKKLAIGGAIAATAATALAAHGAGGFKNLASGLKNAGGIKNAASTFGNNIKGGATKLYQSGKNLVKKAPQNNTTTAGGDMKLLTSGTPINIQ